MALTEETLKANEVLSALTEEQLKAITTLSKNDEDTVIGSKIGEIHRQYDETILKATGIERDGDEKSYKYLERAGTSLREKAKASKEYKAQLESLTAEKNRLEQAIASGSTDKELKTKYDNAVAELEQTKTQFTELQTKQATLEEEHGKKMFGMQVDFEISRATSGIKFKPELPESAAKVLLDQAVQRVKSNTPDFIDDGKGGQRLVFRNESGALLNNPENKLNPFTAAELLSTELKAMGVLDEGRKAGGAGSEAGKGGKGGVAVDLSSARNQIEANEIITKQLVAQGLTRGSDAFDEASTKAWREGNISKLPER